MTRHKNWYGEIGALGEGVARNCEPLRKLGAFFEIAGAHLLETSIVGAPVDVELVAKHVLDLRREYMCKVVRRLVVIPRFALVVWLTSAFVGLVKSIYSGLRDARSFAQVSLDRLVHADQELVALVAHPRDEDMQTIGFELPIARRRVALVIDRLYDYFQRPVIPMARRGIRRRCYERQRGNRKGWLF